MEILKLKSSNITENPDTSHYNKIKEELWLWVFMVICIVVLMALLLYLLKKYIEGPYYKKPNRIENKVVIITGCNRGIGKETAMELARRGARVYMACRNYEACEEAREDIIKETKNLNVYNRSLDLSCLASVRKFVEQFLKEEQRLDILINNAALINKTRCLSPQAFEMQLATNHLGHFLLTNLLLNTLKISAPSRIVVVTSAAHFLARIKKSDINSEKSYFWISAFLQSKFCNTLFTLKLAEILKDSQVTVNCLHPGLVRTDLVFENTWCLLHPLIRFFTKSISGGAQTSIYLALAKELENSSGGYYTNMQKSYMPPWVKNMQLADWLWEESLKMVDLKSEQF